jgi:hypothetical protein
LTLNMDAMTGAPVEKLLDLARARFVWLRPASRASEARQPEGKETQFPLGERGKGGLSRRVEAQAAFAAPALGRFQVALYTAPLCGARTGLPALAGTRTGSSGGSSLAQPC